MEDWLFKGCYRYRFMDIKRCSQYGDMCKEKHVTEHSML